MNEKYVINIGRQLGSGGRLVGEELAKSMGISFYDKELIRIAAKESGLGKEFFEQADEKTKFNYFDNILGWFSSLGGEGYVDNYLQNETLFKIQSDVIRELADDHSCVFVGRCADYILRDNPRCINIFFCADKEDRIRQVMEYEKISESEAQEMMEKADKQRADYYNYYTGKNWGDSSSYHLCINTSLLGIEKTTEYVRSFVESGLKMK